MSRISDHMSQDKDFEKLLRKGYNRHVVWMERHWATERAEQRTGQRTEQRGVDLRAEQRSESSLEKNCELRFNEKDVQSREIYRCRTVASTTTLFDSHARQNDDRVIDSKNYWMNSCQWQESVWKRDDVFLSTSFFYNLRSCLKASTRWFTSNGKWINFVSELFGKSQAEQHYISRTTL